MGARYLAWRTTTLNGTGIAGFALGFVEVLNYLFTFLGIVLYWRIKRRVGPPSAPEGTLDVFIPVCGEPVDVVERTLQAALRIDYPHNTYLLNDGKLANKSQWRQIEALAARYGVQCFTRTDGPRRKAGNLNNAMRQTDGEFIAVIDADHTARVDFAHQMLGYFGDPDVAYVASAQYFETPRGDIFGNKEELFYHYIQPAKDAANSAISCGNGVIYRREALEDIGGFSEWNIVEDLHTSYQMHSRGWTSVYHPRPVTRGLAPLTGVEVIRQRLGWATDSLRLILWDNPITKSGLTLWQRLNYLHLGGFYLVMVTQLMFFIAPALVLLWGVPLVRSESAWAYVVHAVPYFGLQFLYLALVGGVRGGLRSIQKGIFLAPTYLLAAVRAATGINFSSPVTEKQHQKTISWVLLPQLLLFGLLMISIAQALRDPSWARAVAAVWAAWIASALAIPLSTVGIRRWYHRSVRQFAQVSVAGAAAVAAVLAFMAHGAPSDQRPASEIVSMPPREESTDIVISGMTVREPIPEVHGETSAPEPEPDLALVAGLQVRQRNGSPEARSLATSGSVRTPSRGPSAQSSAVDTAGTQDNTSAPDSAVEAANEDPQEQGGRQAPQAVTPPQANNMLGGGNAELE